jgi:response regulator RpfG family c-di-GMP phosphodiesterase
LPQASQTYGDLPIIMLTARDDDIDKIVGLELGADDYLTKPFNPRELVARIKAILRRAGPKTATQVPLQAGDLVIHPARREATVREQEIALRAKEFDLLVALVQHKGMVLSREQLLDLVWGFDFAGQTRRWQSQRDGKTTHTVGRAKAQKNLAYGDRGCGQRQRGWYSARGSIADFRALLPGRQVTPAYGQRWAGVDHHP